MNFLASPPLVIAYALAGTMAVDFEAGGEEQRMRSLEHTGQYIPPEGLVPLLPPQECDFQNVPPPRRVLTLAKTVWLLACRDVPIA